MRVRGGGGGDAGDALTNPSTGARQSVRAEARIMQRLLNEGGGVEVFVNICAIVTVLVIAISVHSIMVANVALFPEEVSLSDKAIGPDHVSESDADRMLCFPNPKIHCLLNSKHDVHPGHFFLYKFFATHVGLNKGSTNL